MLPWMIFIAFDFAVYSQAFVVVLSSSMIVSTIILYSGLNAFTFLFRHIAFLQKISYRVGFFAAKPIDK